MIGLRLPFGSMGSGRAGTKGADVLLVSLGSDLPVPDRLPGHAAGAPDHGCRPPRRDAVLVVPELEAPRVVPRPGVFEIRPWGETEDPVALVAGHAGRPGARAGR